MIFLFVSSREQPVSSLAGNHVEPPWHWQSISCPPPSNEWVRCIMGLIKFGLGGWEASLICGNNYVTLYNITLGFWIFNLLYRWEQMRLLNLNYEVKMNLTWLGEFFALSQNTLLEKRTLTLILRRGPLTICHAGDIETWWPLSVIEQEAWVASIPKMFHVITS